MPRLHATIARISALTLTVTAVLALTAVTASRASTPYRPDRAELQRALDAVVRSGAPGAIVLVRDLFDDPRRTWAPRDLNSRATTHPPLFAPW